MKFLNWLNYIKITQRSTWGILKGGHPLESYFSLLNFLLSKKRKFRPSGLSACGLSDCGLSDHRIPSLTKPCYAKDVMKKKLEQGITDFKEFISENCYFVDKTRLIAYLIDHPSKVHLITRPRRFGKTLNLSMIRYFFEAPPPHGGSNDSPPNAALFNGMSIAEHPQCREYMGQYPVIHLSFKDAKGSSHTECMEIIKDMLSAEYQRHEYLQDCEVLREIDKELFFKISNKKGNDQNCAQSIKHLSAWLKRAYGKPVYILLDEYDTPLHAAYTDNFYDEMIAFIRSFMVQSFKDNPNLKQAVVIGILKVAQESIFSDFNNPAVSTLLDPEMEDCFGFTEPEVEGPWRTTTGLGTRWTASGNGTTATSSAGTRSSTIPGA